MEDTHFGQRPSEIRIAEALETGGDLFVVSCPKDFVMFSDAVKAKRCEDRIVVSDIVTLLAEGLARQTVSA